MGNTIRWMFIFYIVMLLIGCNRTNIEKSEFTIKISPLDDPCPSVMFDSIFENISYVPLQTNNKCLIAEVTKLKVIGDNTFILDAKQDVIYRFSSKGIFLNSIGIKGKGPGEYLNPSFFDINLKLGLVYVYDRRQKKILKYKFNGTYVSDINIDLYCDSFYKSKDDDFIAFMTNDGNDGIKNEELVNFIRLDKHGKEKNKIRGIENYNLLFSNGSHISRINNQTSFVLALHDHIYSFNGNEVSVKYNLDFQEDAIPIDFLQQIIGDKREDRLKNRKFMREAKSKYALGFLKFIEANQWIYLEYLCKNRGHFVFYNKGNGTTYNMARLPFNDDGWETTFKMQDAANENVFYASFHPSSLRKLAQTCSGFYSSKRQKEIKEFLNRIKDESNPVIVKYELKNN